VKYDLGHSLRIGNRSSNQDRIEFVETDDSVLMVLGDGMGGHIGGDLAARTLVDCVKQAFIRAKKPLTQPKRFLKRAINEANDAVTQLGHGYDLPMSPGTTCVVCVIQNGAAWWAHVGDSRLYHVRGEDIIYETPDDSYVAELYRRGKINRDQMLNHPMRNYITRCIGGTQKTLEATCSNKTPLKVNDIILLCSDGLWGPLPDATMTEILEQHELNEAVNTLAYQAEQLSYPYSDNISVVALKWLGNTKGKKKPDPRKNKTPVNLTEEERLSAAINEINRAIEEFGNENDD